MDKAFVIWSKSNNAVEQIDEDIEHLVPHRKRLGRLLRGIEHKERNKKKKKMTASRMFVSRR